MRIETFEEYGKMTGRTIHGAVKIQYPVYNLHLKMLTKDVDPYFPIDRAVIKYATLQPDIDLAYLAALIGLDTSFVRWRVGTLMEENMLALHGVEYSVTENGDRKYLAENPVQKDRVIYGNLVVDGNTLELLDKSFYKNKAWLLDRKSDVFPHKPLLSVNDNSIKKTLKGLERMTPDEKNEYCMEGASHDYEVVDFDAQSLDDVYIVFSSDNETKRGRRDVLYKNKVLDLEQVSEEIKMFYFSLYNGEFYNSQGYHPRQKNPLYSFSSDEIIAFIQKRYDIKEVLASDFDYCDWTDCNHPYPLTIKATKELLHRAKDRKRLVIDAVNGTISQTLHVGANRNVKIGFFNIHVDNSIPVFTSLYTKLFKWEGRLNSAFVEQELSSDPEWRNSLVYIRCFEELEEIDIDKFISYYGNE